MELPKLSIIDLKVEATNFCLTYSKEKIHGLYGVTDGKAVGTFIEHEFQKYLEKKYFYEKGNSAKGIDLPSDDINVDIKVTSVKQPQSSCPFKSTRQKIYGLGYNLLVFVYDKTDYAESENYSILNFVSCAFVDEKRTGDFQLTSSILSILENGGNKDDILATFQDKNLPGDDIIFNDLAEEILKVKPLLGYLTISNALQWRLQYGRIVNMQSSDGLYKLI